MTGINTWISVGLLLIYSAATLVQMVGWWFIYRKVLKIPVDIPDEIAGWSPPLSVVICARNEAENLKRYLPVVLQQHYPDFEVIVVNDASSDDTAAVLSGFKKQWSGLRVITILEKSHPGKKEALSAGIHAAKNEYLVLTDADCRPASSRWLMGMAKAFSTGAELVLGYGPFQKSSGFFNKWARFEVLFTAVQYFSWARAGVPYMGVGRNIGYKKGVFKRTGGFQKHAHLPSGDDDLLVNEAAIPGMTGFCLHPDTFLESVAPEGLTVWIRQKRRHLGAGLSYRYITKYLIGGMAASHTVHYGLGFILLILNIGIIPVPILYAARIILVASTYRQITRLFRCPDLNPSIPILDGLLAVYYGTIVPWALFFQKQPIHWR